MAWGAVLGAAASIGGSLLGANKGAEASKDAANRQAQAAQAALEEQRRQYNLGLQIQAPYMANSYAAGGQLADLLGLNQAGGYDTYTALTGGGVGGASGSASGAGLSAGDSDFGAYVDDHPDLRDAYTSIQKYAALPASKTGGVTLDANGDGSVSKDEYGQFHWATSGQSEGRSLPTYQPPTGEQLSGLLNTGSSTPYQGGRVVDAAPATPASATPATPAATGGYVPVGGQPAPTSVQAYTPPPPAPVVQAPPAPLPTPQAPAQATTAPTTASAASQAVAAAPTNDVAVVQTPGLAQPALGGEAPTGAIPFQRSDLSVSFPTESRLASLLEQADVPAPQTDNAAGVAQSFIDRSPRAQAAQMGYMRAGEDALRQQLAAGGVSGSGRGALALADYGGEFAARQFGSAYDDAVSERDFARTTGSYLDNWDLGRYSREVGERAYDQSLLNSEGGWLAGERGYGDAERQQVIANLMNMYNPGMASNVANQGNQFAANTGQQQLAAANNQALAGVQQANIWGNAIGSIGNTIGQTIGGTDWSKVFGQGSGSGASSTPSFNYGAGTNSEWWK